MQTDSIDTEPSDPGNPSDGSAEGGVRSIGSLLFRIIVGAIIAASFGVWVYAYSGFAEREAPDLLADRAAVASAEAACANALVDVEAMPGAIDAVDGADRGDQISRSTDRFEDMLDELDALVADEVAFISERDRTIANAWLSDWRVLIEDRRTYAAAIAADPNAQFLVTNTGVGERLDRRITRLANTNAMPSCVAPTDVG